MAVVANQAVAFDKSMLPTTRRDRAGNPRTLMRYTVRWLPGLEILESEFEGAVG
jgi:hypothetical protein